MTKASQLKEAVNYLDSLSELRKFIKFYDEYKPLAEGYCIGINVNRQAIKLSKSVWDDIRLVNTLKALGVEIEE